MKQRDFLTDEEHMELVKVGDDFWEELCRIAGEAISKMPEDLEDLTTAYLQDKTSIYNTNIDKYIERKKS